MFRKICQAFGASLVIFGLFRCFNLMVAMVRGEILPTYGLLALLFTFTIGCGLGTMLILFDPHKVIQLYPFKFHHLTSPRSDRKSFSERIGVGDDDD